MSAPAICVVAAHPPTPKASKSTIRPPVSRWRWMESRELPGAATGISSLSHFSMRSPRTDIFMRPHSRSQAQS